MISLTEYREFLIRQTQIPLSVLDSKKDGEVSAEELNSMAGILQNIDEILVLSLLVERHADGFVPRALNAASAAGGARCT